jgi:hypothetical protein
MVAGGKAAFVIAGTPFYGAAVWREVGCPNLRNSRQEEITSPVKVTIQTITEIHNIASDSACKGGKSAANDSRRLASEYIPSGNTMLQSSGEYVRGTRRTPCFRHASDEWPYGVKGWNAAVSE